MNITVYYCSLFHKLQITATIHGKPSSMVLNVLLFYLHRFPDLCRSGVYPNQQRLTAKDRYLARYRGWLCYHRRSLLLSGLSAWNVFPAPSQPTALPPLPPELTAHYGEF